MRERRGEVGILRALGKHGRMIAMLFLGKAFLIGLAGGLIGCLGGFFAAQWFVSHSAPGTFGVATLSPTLWVAALLGAPLVACMAAYLPTLVALTQDPAGILAG